MNYQDCLNACIQHFSNKVGVADIYRAYPPPSPKVWSRCQKQVHKHELLGMKAQPLDYMGEYELKLVDQGVVTVPAKLGADKIDGRITSPTFFVVLAKSLVKERAAIKVEVIAAKNELIAQARREGIPLSDPRLGLAEIRSWLAN